MKKDNKELISVVENISPETKVEEIEKDLVSITKKVEDLKILNEEQYQGANNFLVEVKGRVNRIKDLKNEWVKPLKDHVKKLEGLFNKPQNDFEGLEQVIKHSMSEYRLEIEREARKKEEKQRKRAEKRAEKAKEKGQEPDYTPLPTIERPTSTVESDGGKSTARKVVKFEVTDVHALPPKIKKQVLDKAFERGLVDTIIRPYVSAEGVDTSIKGVRVYEDYNISVSV